MRALITGSNGFLGSTLAEHLSQRGDFVRCLVRKGSDVSLLPKGVEVFEGDVTDAVSLEKSMEGVTVVFHLAGIRRAPAKEAFFEVNTEGTRKVCDAMLKSQTAKRLVLCSSLAASGPSSMHKPLVEEDDFKPTEWYGESKAAAEKLAFTYQGPLEVTAIRPARILGPKDKENLVFFKLVKKGLCLQLGGGPRPLSMVDVDDVVELMCLLADKPEAVGHAFFCAADETTTLEMLQSQVAETLQIKCRRLWVPPTALRSLAAVADVISRLSGRHLPLNRKLARQLLAPAWTCSNAKAKRLLGFSPKHSLEDSIRESASWYQSHGWLK